MAKDIFDTLTLPKDTSVDVFDKISKPKGDIFDRIGEPSLPSRSISEMYYLLLHVLH